MLKNFKKIINNIFKNYPKTMQRWFFATNHKDIGSLYLFFGFCAGVIGLLNFIIVKTEFPLTHCLNINNMLIFLSQVLLIFFFKNFFFFKIFFQTNKNFKFLKNNVFSFIIYYFENTIWIPLKKYFQKFWYGEGQDLQESIQESIQDNVQEKVREIERNFQVNNIWSESDGEEISDDWSDDFSDYFLNVCQLHDPIRSGFLVEYYIEHAPKVLIAANYLTEC